MILNVFFFVSSFSVCSHHSPGYLGFILLCFVFSHLPQQRWHHFTHHLLFTIMTFIFCVWLHSASQLMVVIIANKRGLRWTWKQIYWDYNLILAPHVAQWWTSSVLICVEPSVTSDHQQQLDEGERLRLERLKESAAANSSSSTFAAQQELIWGEELRFYSRRRSWCSSCRSDSICRINKSLKLKSSVSFTLLETHQSHFFISIICQNVNLQMRLNEYWVVLSPRSHLIRSTHDFA